MKNLIFYIHCKKESTALCPWASILQTIQKPKKSGLYYNWFTFSSGRCKADICDLPFEDNQYDVILCNHVLEHIPDDTKAMQELYRVLKPGGWPFYKSSRAIKSCNFSDDTITDQKNALKYLDNMIMSHIWSWLFWQAKT
jgi:ubiquinone/menaquinone biosynthesis C-methylase UbiE